MQSVLLPVRPPLARSIQLQIDSLLEGLNRWWLPPALKQKITNCLQCQRRYFRSQLPQRYLMLVGALVSWLPADLRHDLRHIGPRRHEYAEYLLAIFAAKPGIESAAL